MDWYIADGDVQKGPFRLEDLPAQGLRPDSLVWKSGMERWQRADTVEDIRRAGFLGPAPAPTPAVPVAYETPAPLQGPPPFNPAASNRIAAGLCGLLLGGFGIHKFILGMPTPGIIMLLATILGWVFTCGLGSIVVGIIGFIEGILYLTKSEEQFYWDYVVHKRQWF